MIRQFIKKIPTAKWLNQFLLDIKIMRNFLNCSTLELQQTEFYKQFINKNDLVFDVGCNVGSRTKLFLKLGANVVGYEPQEELCNHLHAHLKRNRKFSLEKIGLGANQGVADIRISDAHVLSSMSDRWITVTKESGRFNHFNWGNCTKVAVSTLDEKIKEYGIPQFIKIDVEGYEFEVLSGLSSPVNYISIEFTAEDIDNSFKCLRYMSELGQYLFNYSLGESLKFEDQVWKTKDEIESQLKIICVTKDKSWGDIYARHTK